MLDQFTIQDPIELAKFIKGLSNTLSGIRGLRGPGYMLGPAGYGGQQFADGGYVQGPGTGTSDSVPAIIDGNEPAALSNGEFVFTAQAVKNLGGGDADKGAAILNKLMKLAEHNPEEDQRNAGLTQLFLATR